MTDSSESSSRPSIRCFISYAHDDEMSLSFIDDFKSTLEHFTYADSGRRLEIFLDHDSIGWGDDWRESIRRSIDTALVFIPIVTLQYLDRPLCREEVQLFVDGARKLGVTELFLPVVVLGHRQITEQSTDRIAQLIARRQYKDLKQAVLQGTSSAIWRTTMLDLSEALVSAVEKAEHHIVERSAGQREQPDPSGIEPRPSGDDDAAPGLLELMEQLNEGSSRLTELASEFAELMIRLQTVMAPLGVELQGADQAKGRAVLNRVAEATGPVAKRVDEVGTEMEAITAKVDGAFRSAWGLAVESGHEGFKNSLRQGFEGSGTNNFSGLTEVVDMMTDILNQMKGIEVISVPMRAALRPLRKGLTSVRSAVSTVQAWPDLVSEGDTPPAALPQ